MCWPSFGVDIGHQGGVSVRTKYSDSLFVVPFMRVFSVCMLSVACAQMVRVRGSQAGLWFPCVSVGVRHRSWFFFTARPKPDLVSFFFTTRPKLDLVSPSQHDRGSPLPQSFLVPDSRRWTQTLHDYVRRSPARHRFGNVAQTSFKNAEMK